MPLRIVALVLALLVSAGGSGRAIGPGSQVVVSSTLSNTLHVFDASTLAETQPPLPVRGTSPVRLWVERFGDKTLLLSANHGIQGSLGVYDLDGPIVTELPLSPFLSGGQGSVGVTAGRLQGSSRPVILLTDTVQALGGCGLPEGSVTAFDAALLASHGIATRFATEPSGGTIPYAVAFDGAHALVSNTCNDTLTRFSVGETGDAIAPLAMARAGSTPTSRGPDAVLFDETHERTYVTTIAGNTLDVFERNPGTGPSTVVPLAGAGPIDATLADAPSGRRWVISSNGRDDTVSVIDRDIIDACVAAGAALCGAEVARIFAGVRGGAPEGVAYDPKTNRVFVVNKTPGAPALSVIQLVESPDGVTGAHIATMPLRIMGSGTPLPDPIAFDVVVRVR